MGVSATTGLPFTNHGAAVPVLILSAAPKAEDAMANRPKVKSVVLILKL